MKYLYLGIFLLLLSACGQGSEETNGEEQLDENFSVSGTIADAAGMTLYLEALSEKGQIAVANSTIESDGSFSLKGNVPGMGIYQLRLGEAQDKIIPLTLSPDENVKINTSFRAFNVAPNVSGTEWAAYMNGYMKLYAEMVPKQMELNGLQGKVSEDEIMKLYMEIKEPLDEYSRKKMNADPDNPFNIVLSTAATPTTGFQNWDPANLDVLKKVAAAFKKRYKDSPMALTMENQVYQIEVAYNEYKANASGTKTAPEIAMKNPAGKVPKLSSLRGKVVLIDFWASWCGPCRRENPNVVRLYNQYKDKGFTVFSVSLDEDATAWKNAIAADGLIWPNHVSDLLGWKTPMTQLYGFNGIPYTVLVDRDGKIIGTGLRGEILEQKLKEVLAN